MGFISPNVVLRDQTLGITQELINYSKLPLDFLKVTVGSSCILIIRSF